MRRESAPLWIWDQITTILLFILKLLYTSDSPKWFQIGGTVISTHFKMPLCFMSSGKGCIVSVNRIPCYQRHSAVRKCGNVDAPAALPALHALLPSCLSPSTCPQGPASFNPAGIGLNSSGNVPSPWGGALCCAILCPWPRASCGQAQNWNWTTVTALSNGNTPELSASRVCWVPPCSEPPKNKVRAGERLLLDPRETQGQASVL